MTKIMIVKPIDSATAQMISIEKHYLHRECPCTQAYGLFDDDNVLIGVMIYGVPASSTLKKGICGEDEANNVIELKRLYVDDCAPRFQESFFLSQSFRLMKKDHPEYDIMVSYQDSEYGHVGTIYQATNWYYTGTSAPFADYTEAGSDLDHLSVEDKWKAKYGSVREQRKALGDKVVKTERSLKYRYVRFNGLSRARNQQLLSKLKYQIQPYPKTDVHGHYEAKKNQCSLFDWGGGN